MNRVYTSALLSAALFTTIAPSHAAVEVSTNGGATWTFYAASPCGLIIASAAAGTRFRLTTSEVCGNVAGETYDGLIIDANGTAALPIIFDMRGHSISSAKNVEGAVNADEDAAAIAGIPDENHGIAIGGNWVRLTNTNTAACSKVEFFTSNFDIGGNNVTVEGMTGPCSGPGVPANSFNLMGGVAFGGGVLAMDRAQRLTVRRVLLHDPTFILCGGGTNPLTSPVPCENPDEAGAGAGDNGVDLKRCTGPLGLFEDNYIVGKLAGLRVRGCTNTGLGNVTVTNGVAAPADITRNYGFVVRRNTIIASTPDGLAAVEMARDVQNALFSGNTLMASAAGGVGIDLGGGNGTRNVTIVPKYTAGGPALGNIVSNACDIDISAGAVGIYVTPPSNANNTVPSLAGSTFTHVGAPAFFNAAGAAATCVNIP